MFSWTKSTCLVALIGITIGFLLRQHLGELVSDVLVGIFFNDAPEAMGAVGPHDRSSMDYDSSGTSEVPISSSSASTYSGVSTPPSVYTLTLHRCHPSDPFTVKSMVPHADHQRSKHTHIHADSSSYKPFSPAPLLPLVDDLLLAWPACPAAAADDDEDEDHHGDDDEEAVWRRAWHAHGRHSGKGTRRYFSTAIQAWRRWSGLCSDSQGHRGHRGHHHLRGDAGSLECRVDVDSEGRAVTSAGGGAGSDGAKETRQGGDVHSPAPPPPAQPTQPLCPLPGGGRPVRGCLPRCSRRTARHVLAMQRCSPTAAYTLHGLWPQGRQYCSAERGASDGDEEEEDGDSALDASHGHATMSRGRNKHTRSHRRRRRRRGRDRGRVSSASPSGGPDALTVPLLAGTRVRVDGRRGAVALLEGATTGAGGAVTSLLDVLLELWPSCPRRGGGDLPISQHLSFWRHEYAKHGSCAGMPPVQYLARSLELLLQLRGRCGGGGGDWRAECRVLLDDEMRICGGNVE